MMTPAKMDVHMLVNIECIRLLGEVVRPNHPPRLRFRILKVPGQRSIGISRTRSNSKHDSLLFLILLRRCTWLQSVRRLLAFFR